MNFNHLVVHLPKTHRCLNSSSHYWVPTGTVEASIGDNIRVDFYCKHCKARHTEFLTMKTYRTHEKVLRNSRGDSQ
jgi:hypothetical protein